MSALAHTVRVGKRISRTYHEVRLMLRTDPTRPDAVRETPPSLLDGGPLTDPGPRSLVELLPRAAGLNGGPAIVHLDDEGTESRRSYGELLDEASRVLTGLREAAVRPGDLVILPIGDGPLLLVAFWACVLGGLVPVPVPVEDPGTDGGGMAEQVWRSLGEPWIVTGRGRPSAGWDERMRSRWLGTVEDLRRPAADHGWTGADRDDLALLTLTAGSSGAPKAVRLSHRNILARSAGTTLANDLTADTVTFNWMPLGHVSGLVMCHIRDVYLACTQIHAPKRWVLADPLRWLDAVDRYRAEVTWATNSSFDMISDRAAEIESRSWDLRCLRYIMNGGQAVKSRTVRRFLTLLAPFGLPSTAMRPGWGMSETSSGVVDHRTALETLPDAELLPVGRPHPGVSVRVVDGADRTVPEGVLGYLQVTGVAVTDGYHHDPEQTRRSFTPDGWFRTGDLAVVSDGALTVTGSAEALIQVAGKAYQAHEIEAVVEELPFVEKTFTVACGVGTDGAELAVFCSLVGGVDVAEASAEIRRTVLARCGVQVSHVVPMPREEIPKTATGKPMRARLRESFAPGAGAGAADPARPASLR